MLYHHSCYVTGQLQNHVCVNVAKVDNEHSIPLTVTYKQNHLLRNKLTMVLVRQWRDNFPI